MGCLQETLSMKKTHFKFCVSSLTWLLKWSPTISVPAKADCSVYAISYRLYAIFKWLHSTFTVHIFTDTWQFLKPYEEFCIWYRCYAAQFWGSKNHRYSREGEKGRIEWKGVTGPWGTNTRVWIPRVPLTDLI